MLVWVTRDTYKYSEVEVWIKEPTFNGHTYHNPRYDKNRILRMDSEEFKNLFDFTICPGECKKYKMKLEK